MLNFFRTGSSLHREKYRPDIDGIRAIAIISVVVCHAFPELLPGGFVGVDIFFVISGYLISLILIRDFNSNSFSILHFYNRRIRRIFPALIVVLIFTVLFGWFCLFRPEFFVLGQHVIASTLFSENFLLWNESGYFDVSSELKPTLHLWSLAIEEQFYIIWPFLMYFAHRKHINYALMFLFFAGLSFAINIHDINNDPIAAYYSPLGRFWELMMGSFLAYIQTNRPALLAEYKNVQSILGIFLILLSLLFIRADSRFPGFWAHYFRPSLKRHSHDTVPRSRHCLHIHLPLHRTPLSTAREQSDQGPFTAGNNGCHPRVRDTNNDTCHTATTQSLCRPNPQRMGFFKRPNAGF